MLKSVHVPFLLVYTFRFHVVLLQRLTGLHVPCAYVLQIELVARLVS